MLVVKFPKKFSWMFMVIKNPIRILIERKITGAASRENVSSGIFDQVRFKPACPATGAS